MLPEATRRLLVDKGCLPEDIWRGFDHDDGITRACTTGGACSAKTTLLNKFQQDAGNKGIYTVVVPEVATEHILAGITPFCSYSDPLWFQRQILLAIIEKENRLVSAFRGMKLPGDVSKLLITDRGTMDGEAYCGKIPYKHMLAELGTTPNIISNGRYRGVIHLVTAAIGAEKFYTLRNNSARSETLEQARALDERTRNAWVLHPHLRIVPNEEGGIDAKYRKFRSLMFELLGKPIPIEDERKFIVTVKALPTHTQVVDIEQYYIDTPEVGHERIRVRTQFGRPMYYRTRKIPVPGEKKSKNYESESLISESEFARLMRHLRSDRRPIKKQRLCFIHDYQYFELDYFQDFLTGLIMLEIELTKLNRLVSIPDFLEVIAEVTDDERYSNQNLADTGADLSFLKLNKAA